MTITNTQTRFKNSGKPRPAGLSGGAFAPEDPKPEAAENLEVSVLPGLNRDQATAYVEDLAANIDAATVEADSAATDIDDAVALGKAQATAEILAYVLAPDIDGDFGHAGEDLLNARQAGILVELGSADEITSLKRGLIHQYAVRSAEQAFRDAEEVTDIPDVAALHMSRAETFQDIAMDLSNPLTDFEGK